MTATDPQTAAQQRTGGLVTGQEPRKPTLAAVARRIASRTTDLIAMGVVLIGCLTIGRQVVEWWRADPEEIAVSPAGSGSSNPWDRGPVQIEFGDAPLALDRRIIEGDRESAMARVVADCTAIVKTTGASNLPPALPGQQPAAAGLLNRLAEATPVAHEPGVWSVYRLEDQFSLVVGVREGSPAQAGADYAHRRLVCLAMAAPEGANRWNVSIFRPAAAAAGGSMTLPVDLLPPGCHRSLTLRGQGGEVLMGFRGRGDPEEWKAWFESQLRDAGWVALNGWMLTDVTWLARFDRTDSPGAARLEIALSSSASGDWTGLIHQTP